MPIKSPKLKDHSKISNMFVWFSVILQAFHGLFNISAITLFLRSLPRKSYLTANNYCSQHRMADLLSPFLPVVSSTGSALSAACPTVTVSTFGLPRCMRMRFTVFTAGRSFGSNPAVRRQHRSTHPTKPNCLRFGLRERKKNALSRLRQKKPKTHK